MARGRGQYNAYRGRKPWGRRILLGILAVLVVVLILAVAAFLLLRDSIIYTDQGVVLPFLQGQQTPTPPPAPTPGPEDDPGGELVVESPSPSPSPTPTPTPKPDLSEFPRRELPLGLVVGTLENLRAGIAGEGLEARHGVIFDLTDAETDADADAVREAVLALPYAAAYLAPDWAGADWEDLAARCVELAGLGFDEVVLSAHVPEGDGKDLAEGYRAVKKTLDDAGWQGRLGLVLDLRVLTDGYDPDLIPSVAQSFQRLYFTQTLPEPGRSRLVSEGFEATGYTIVTVAEGPANWNYAWAVLPERDAG